MPTDPDSWLGRDLFLRHNRPATRMYRNFLGMLLASVALVSGALTLTPVPADEGMWLFNDLPRGLLRDRYRFEPDDVWAEHLMKSCVRFNVGGSASFVSGSGLVLTNHHVGSDTLFKLSTPARNLLADGFLAETREQELKAPDLELNQLVGIRDVTSQVSQVVTSDMTPEQAVAARRAVVAGIEKSALDETGLRSNVITLYGGAKYHLYQYKKYTDVRLVWAPETSIAFFGGDADNFEYPRFCLDACLFRVYEDGQPARTPHFLKWSAEGPADGELVFVAGNPGRTSRIFTVAALKFQRDSRLPYQLELLRRQEILLQQYGLRSVENARRARDDLFGVQNSRKARLGMLAGLQDPALWVRREKEETELLDAVSQNPALRDAAAAWQKITATTRRRQEIQGKGIHLGSQLFSIAMTLVQIAEEDQKPPEQRLPEFSEASRESLLQQLYSDAPIYRDLDQVLLADSISRTLEARGFDDALCQKILAGQSRDERAAQLIAGSKLDHVDTRRTVAAGGDAALADSTDPLLQLARLVSPEVRRFRKITDELDELERQAYARIAEALFATRGTSTYPDATFTLRLAFGPVRGYRQNDQNLPAWTTVGGAFAHAEQHAGQADYALPDSWQRAKARLDFATPFNFVSTADIIGGNSGSPVVNRSLELVGLIFDGNLQSLSADFVYSEKQSRSVSVHAGAIRQALQIIYGAEHIVRELGH